VVGESETSAQGGDRHAFVHDGTAMRDLNDILDASGAGWLVQEARDIDDAGRIVANATHNGVIHAVLLTPVPG
jgi:probable HAF family extracellular repeat protein